MAFSRRPCGKRRTALFRRVLQLSVVVTGWLVGSTLPVYAHGVASGDQLAPPLFTAGAVGFVIYWLIVLWPSQGQEAGAQGTETQFFALVGGRMMERLDEEKSNSHLRPVDRGYNDSAFSG